MNKTLIEFFEGTIRDSSGRLLSEIRGASNKWLEETHDYIQWMFPNREPSVFNPDAPLLDDETIESFKLRNDLKYEVGLCLERMIYFYNLDELEERPRPWWVSKKNHNFLRITRILNTLREFEMNEVATDFFDMLTTVYLNNKEIIGEVTFKFWEQALTGFNEDEGEC